MVEVRGAGGGGKGGSGDSGGHESDDTLFSTAYIEVIEAVAEGPVKGVVNGGKSIYMENTPITAVDGNKNHNVAWDTRLGWQDQTPFPMVQSISAEQSIGVLVPQATPAIATITDADADYATVTLGFPRMMSADEKGNISGTSIEFLIECQAYGGPYLPVSRRITQTQGIAADNRFQSPLKTFKAEVHFLSWSAAASVIDLYYSTDGINWAVIETVQLTRNTFVVMAEMFSGYVSLELPEGQHYLRWQVVDYSGSYVYADGSLNSVRWSSYVDGPITLTGKSMSKYQQQYRFPLPGSAPWSVRVTRVSADSHSAKLANDLYFDSLRTEVVAQLNYPNTALIYYKIPAKEFSSIPRRRAEWDLLEVRVPSNYDPISRSYDGIWDGSFKLAWSDNPAWGFYDIYTSDRYGIGKYVDASEIDKWALYEIGKYCDVMVDSGLRDGSGAVIYEPRFTLNIHIVQPREAFEILRDLASVFRGMMYVINGLLTCVADRPSDVAKLFNQTNVIDGQFRFSGTAALARKTVALVGWKDPADLYNDKVEYVQDLEGIKRYGMTTTEVVAVGCTSRGQAHRLGKWLLMDGEVVTFEVGHDAAFVRPGEIIACMIPLRSKQNRLGGRIKNIDGLTVTLDAPVSLVAGHAYQLSVMQADGSIGSRSVSAVLTETTDTLTLPAVFDVEIVDHALWVLIDWDGIKPTLWKVIGITEGNDFTKTLTALSHDPDKFDKIDNFASAIDGSIFPAVNPLEISPVSDIVVENWPFTDLNNIMQNRLVAYWSQVSQAARYQLRWRVNAGNWIAAPTQTGTLFEMIIKDDGTYDVEIVAVSVLGVPSPAAQASVMITGEASALNFDAQWSD